ncbi:MAG TPA: helix-turn-helix domain-containing protein [Solirubrobacteraceae bacterium]|nr:helix-turn-helix domain-containing protein [Solirubrobacteraceae bacterium]
MLVPGDVAIQRIATMLAARRAELASESLTAIRAAIPAYGDIDDPVILADVTEHVAENHDALRASLVRGRPVTEQDLAFIRPHAALRARRGVPLADFLHAFRIGHRVIWDAIQGFADLDDEARDAALEAARLVMEFIDHASTHAAQAYLEAQQLLLAEGDRVRRDLLEDLLAGRTPTPGPRLGAARTAGLDSGGRCLLIAAVPVSPADDELALRSAASALARAAGGGALRPLTVVRQDEIVIVRALGTQDPRRLTEPVERAQRELAGTGVRLAIGISTAFDSTAGLPDAYREASAALESMPPGGGVMSLPDLSAFDYLTLRSDGTVLRLLTPAVRRFVEDDTAAGGSLTSTLLAYAAANLNAKVTAQRLFIHVNTAHHRLARIEERTGCDLRDLADVQELLIAIRLARHPIRTTTAAP